MNNSAAFCQQTSRHLGFKIFWRRLKQCGCTDVGFKRPFRDVPVQAKGKGSSMQSGKGPIWILRKHGSCSKSCHKKPGSLMAYAMIKNLLHEAALQLCQLMCNWELEGRLPDQVSTTLVVLLPKKPTNQQLAAQSPGDASAGRQCPGTHVIQVPFMRLALFDQ